MVRAGAFVVLHHFYAVEDNGPAFASQNLREFRSGEGS
jgi:hypothetical protein